VCLLLDQKAEMDVRDNNGDTPLHSAAACGDVDVSRLLLKRGADVNAENDEGSTPLHRASEVSSTGNSEIVRLLLNHGADVLVRTLSGKTASEVALDADKHEIVRFLSKHAQVAK